MQPKPITAQGIMYQPEVFLLIAGLLALIAGIAGGAATVYIAIMGLFMGGSALISLNFIEVSLPLKNTLSFLTVSATFGAILLINWIQLFVTNLAGWWGTWVLFVSALLSLFAAFRAVVLKKY